MSSITIITVIFEREDDLFIASIVNDKSDSANMANIANPKKLTKSIDPHHA